MSLLNDKLSDCFSSVFPEVDPTFIRAATPDNVARWDSSNHVTLIQVIEEEFAISIPESAAGELLSYADFESYLRSRTPSA